MWAMMSPEQHYDNEEIGGGGASRHIYVHHVNEDNHINPMMGYPRPPPPQQLPQQLPPQPMFIPMPYPQTMPMQMPMYMGGGGGYGYPQFPQQPIVIISGSGDEEKAKDGGGGDTKSPPAPPPPPPEPKRPPFHPACLVSIIFFFIGSILGFICVAKIYDVFESSLSYEDNQQEQQLEDENKDVDEHILDYLVVHRTVALVLGAVSILMFCIAFMLAFYCGMRYRLSGSGGGSSSKKKNCCLTGLLISAWILFCLTFINGLIILVLAFDEGARIYPEVALCAVLGNMAAWICMFSYCLLARIL